MAGLGTLLTLLALASAPAAPITSTTPDAVASAIRQPLRHPYLYLNETELIAIREHLAHDPEARRVYGKLKAEADTLMVMPRLPRRPNVLGLAFVYWMTGEAAYAQKAYEIISPGFGQPLSEGFDLNTSRRLRSLAPLYDWLYNGLDADQRDAIRKEMMRHLNLLRGRYDETWWTHAWRTNWNAVCQSAAGVAALSLLAEDPSLIDMVTKSYNGILNSYNEIGRDGGWTEGVSYYTYMLFVSFLYAEALANVTEGEFDLFQHPQVRENGADFILHTLVPPGEQAPEEGRTRWRPVGFQDSSALSREDSSFGYALLADRSESGQAAWLRQTLFGEAGQETVFDLIWPGRMDPSGLPEEASAHFRDYGWVILRSGFTDPDAFMIAAIAGEHWDPTREMFLLRHRGAEPIPVSQSPWGMEIDTYHFSHGHLNAGTFNLYWRGQPYINELEEPGYPSDFWTVNRWDYPFASSEGRNVITVDGVGQISGKGRGGTVEAFRAKSDHAYARIDATGAYPKRSLKKWTRHLLLEKPNEALVADGLRVDKGSEVRARFHAGVDLSVAETYVLLEGTEGIMAVLPLATVPVTMEAGRHDERAILSSVASGQAREMDLSWDYFDVVVDDAPDELVLATLFLPVASAAEAKEIADSASLEHLSGQSLTVRYTRNGAAQAISFLEANDSLVPNL